MNIETFNADAARELMTKSSASELEAVLTLIHQEAELGNDSLAWHMQLRDHTQEKLTTKGFTVVNMSGALKETVKGPWVISW